MVVLLFYLPAVSTLKLRSATIMAVRVMLVNALLCYPVAVTYSCFASALLRWHMAIYTSLLLSSYQGSLLTTGELLSWGTGDQWVPGEGGCCAGFGWLWSPRRKGEDKGSHLRFTLQSEILYGLILRRFPSPICLEADSLKKGNSHRPL